MKNPDNKFPVPNKETQEAWGEITDTEMTADKLLRLIRLSDQDFLKELGSYDDFKELMEGRNEISSLESVSHNMDGKNILLHTYGVLRNLHTDQLNDIKLDKFSFSASELVRMVALYHDTEKLEGNKNNKDVQAQRAIEEIEKNNPDFFQTPQDKGLFEALLKTCDYFGYNIRLLDKKTDQKKEIDEILERKVFPYIEKLCDNYKIYFDEEDLLAMQYAISRADTLSIDQFKRNVSKLDLLYEKISSRL